MIRFATDTLALLNTETLEARWTAELGSALQYGGLAFSPDGKTIIVGWDNVLRLFESDNGRERFAVDGRIRVW